MDFNYDLLVALIEKAVYLGSIALMALVPPALLFALVWMLAGFWRSWKNRGDE